MELLVPIIFSVLIFLGIILACVPGLPAIFYMLLISLVFGFVNDFMLLTPKELLILTCIYLVSFLVDLFSGVLGARYGGAAFKSILIGLLGILLGTLVLPPFGGILGLFIGVAVSEFLLRGNLRKAIRAASYGVLGIVAGVIVNITIAIAFFSFFISAVFFAN